MKELYVVHGSQFQWDERLKKRVSFAEKILSKALKAHKIEPHEATIVSLGGRHDKKGHTNAEVAYKKIKKNTNIIRKKIEVIMLGGRTFAEEAEMVSDYVQKNYAKEKVKIYTGIEDSALRALRLRLCYQFSFVFKQIKKRAQKWGKWYWVVAPFISLVGLLKKPKTKIQITALPYNQKKELAWWSEFKSLMLILVDPLDRGLHKYLTTKSRK